MTISAKIIADSISPAGIRLTTFQLRYPRFIHAELMTHRLFSRNASSSRAIPVQRMIEDLRRDPAIPVYWGSNQPGMQAGAELEGTGLQDAKNYWIDGMNLAIGEAEKLISLGLHKQIANRMLEPWAHINVVLTATSFENFFALRSHPDAQPEIKILSDLMKEEMRLCVPHECREDEWHLPYILDSDWLALKALAKKGRITRDEPMYAELAKLALRVSVARCARVSYKTHDGRETTVEEDMILADKLITATPLHASPAEHQAMPDMPNEKAEMMAKYGGWEISDDEWENRNEWGNFRGWRQYRKMLPNEFVPG